MLFPLAAGWCQKEKDGADGAETERAGWCAVLSFLKFPVVLSSSRGFLNCVSPQMFLLKAERMKRLEKEKVSVAFFFLMSIIIFLCILALKMNHFIISDSWLES